SAVAGAAQGGTELGEGAIQLQLAARAVEAFDSFVQQADSVLATLDDAGRPQRLPQRSGGSEGPCPADRVTHQGPRRGGVAEAVSRDRRLDPPGNVRRRIDRIQRSG